MAKKSIAEPLTKVELAALRLFDIAQGAAGGQQIDAGVFESLGLEIWLRYCAAVEQAFEVVLEIEVLKHFAGSFDEAAEFLVGEDF